MVVKNKEHRRVNNIEREDRKMKVYKIRNTEAFFETLSECKGEVKVIGKDGIGVTISPGSEEIKVLKNTYLGAMIDDVELKMNNSSDALKMLSFMVTMDHVA